MRDKYILLSNDELNEPKSERYKTKINLTYKLYEMYKLINIQLYIYLSMQCKIKGLVSNNIFQAHTHKIGLPWWLRSKGIHLPMKDMWV